MNVLNTIRVANRVVGAIAPRLTARFARKLLMTPQAHRARDYEVGALERAEQITFRFGLSGLRWGRAGPVVLAMHGWQGRPTQLAAFIEPLLASGRQVIALEGPAHGRSPGREAHVFAFAEALLEAAAEIKGIESVLGHSMGGSAAVHAVSLGLPVKRVATIGSPAALSRVLQRFAELLALPATARRAFVDIVDRYVGVSAEDIDAAKLAPTLGVDGLIVHDRDDGEVPYAEAQAWKAAWQSARVLTTQGLGHTRILTDPTVVDTTTKFLIGAERSVRPIAA